MAKTNKATSYLPADTQAVTPQIVVKGARAYADKLVENFGATKLAEYPNPDGTVMFAVLQIGGSKLFLSDANERSKPTQSNLFVYVPDVDAVVAKIAACGGKVLSPPADMFWGDRWSLVEDPTGNLWQIATHIEAITADEAKKRAHATAAAPPAE
jgi:uncharacterized glyoxalase superfamily protein PhnB